MTATQPMTINECREEYPSFLEHIRARYGRKWCVAHRMTERLRAKGYEAAIHPTRYEREKQEWIAGHPAVIAATDMPDQPWKNFIIKATMTRVGVGA